MKTTINDLTKYKDLKTIHVIACFNPRILSNQNLWYSEKNSIIAEMKKIFEILLPETEVGDSTLTCTIDEKIFSLSIKNEEKKVVTGLAIYQIDNKETADFTQNLAALLAEKDWLKGHFKSVKIISTFKESVLIPFSLYDIQSAPEAINLIHGDFPDLTVIKTDLINKEGVYNVYKIEEALYGVFETYFPGFKIEHIYTSLLNNHEGNKDEIGLVFYPGKIIVSLFKQGKCMLVNSFSYKVPEDVSYTLLNICQQFNAENVPLNISGLIDEDSGLYREIYKYFSEINFTSLWEDYTYPEEISTLPAHYLSVI